VPTTQDFGALNIALGGQSVVPGNDYTNTTVRDRFLNTWGGVYGGQVLTIMEYQGTQSTYWSQSGVNVTNAFGLGFNHHGQIWPQGSQVKNYGLSLRCVRDTVPPPPEGCNNNTPGWGTSLGTVSFATTQQWTVGNQVWSDAVTATACTSRTTQYRGGSTGNFNADCRSTPGYKGDLFSFCAVARFANTLCPAPWQAPTRQDFFDLDIALGGCGDGCTPAHGGTCSSPNGSAGNSDIGCFYYNNAVRNNYINTWGGSYSGYCDGIGALFVQGLNTFYWSQSGVTTNSDFGFLNQYNSNGEIRPQRRAEKYHGFSLRCVRDN
jgi:uncharacterized protein (TIGR02145 family)